MRALVLTSLLLLALVAVERALAPRRGDDPLRAPTVGRLIPPEVARGRTVSALSVADGRGELLYLRSKGLWRSREGFGAIAETAAVEELVACFLEAQGSERTRDRERAAAYGLGPQQTTFRLHGPKVIDDPARDVLFAFEVGTSFAGGAHGLAFVRAEGDDAVLEVDRDPRAVLARHERGGLPPMLDLRLLAGCLGGDFGGFRRFRVEPRAGSAFVVEHGDGPPESSWALVRDGAREPAMFWRAGGYTALWVRGRYQGVASPAQAAELGLDPPELRVTLEADGAEPIVVEVSALRPSGEAWVWNRRTNVVMAVDRDTHAEIAATPAMFTDASRENPWERWLRTK